MRTHLLLILLTTAQLLLAQSPLIDRNHYFEIGDSVLLYHKFDTSLWSLSHGVAGADVLWDFSMVDFGHPSVMVDTLTFIDPEGTPFYPTSMGADYSQSNLCILRRTDPYSPENNEYNYYFASDDSVAFLGKWSANGGAEQWEDHFPDPLRELDFPLEYGNTFTDTYEQYYFDQSGSGGHWRHGTHSVTVDGHGSLITPDGELLTGVIRLHRVMTVNDSSMFGEESYSFERYDWYSASRKGAILSLIIAVWDPELVETAYFQRQTNIITSTSQLFRPGSILVHPNPASDMVMLPSEYGVPLISVELFDLSGRSCRHIPMLNGSLVIDRAGLSAGVYTIKITTATGQTSIARFIFE